MNEKMKICSLAV